MVLDFTSIALFAAAAAVLIAAAVVLIPILTSRSNEPKNPADIES